MKAIRFFVLAMLFISQFSCATKKGAKFLKYPVSNSTSIAVIIDCPSNIKNIVMMKFLNKGFKVKAMNASDFYTPQDVFDIDDFKKLAYENSEMAFWDDLFESDMPGLDSKEKSFNNLYKLHIYNYENHKAEMLSEMAEKWNVRYLVILDLKDWQDVSWGRAIDLTNLDLVWLENYPTKTMDDLDSVVEHFIASLTKR